MFCKSFRCANMYAWLLCVNWGEGNGRRHLQCPKQPTTPQKPVDHDHTQVIDPPQSENLTTSQPDPIVLQSKRRFLL